MPTSTIGRSDEVIDRPADKRRQEFLWCPWPAVTYFLNYPNLWRF